MLAECWLAFYIPMLLFFKNILTAPGTFPPAGTPIKSLSVHSNITRLTSGSALSFMPFGLMNFVRMKGSMAPPQDFREYMPEHTCLSDSFWFYLAMSVYLQ